LIDGFEHFAPMPAAADPSPSESVGVPAKSQHKAMEWSLVLASQGIPHLIASPDESGHWSLRIAPADVTRASAAIRQYERENRARPWQQHYLEGRVVFDWIALVWAALLVAIHALSENHPGIKDAGVMHGIDVLRGEWWRLVTATQLHADWGHLASNLSIGVVLLGLVMGRWGTAPGMLAALLAGIGGNVSNLLIRPDAYSLGASTVVMGCIGLLAVLPRSQTPAAHGLWRGLLTGVGGAVLLFLLLGLDPRSDVLAHTGGFVSGVLLAFGLRFMPGLSQSRWSGRVAFLLLAVLLLLSWRKAF
jgi:rhomboid protease GluP